MSELIKIGCSVADVYHRYQEIHKTLFGTSYLRRFMDVLRGNRLVYGKHLDSLQQFQMELATLEQQIADPNRVTLTTGADRELRNALSGYTRALAKSVEELRVICSGLEQDEVAYRKLGEDGRSRFTADKLIYDQRLLELERLGTRLEKLFSNY